LNAKFLMRFMNGALLMAMMGSIGFACSCPPAITPCTSISTAPIVFVGTVVRDSGDGLGNGPARMRIEEVLHGISPDVGELEVSTGAMTSCYMRLEKSERYLIFASHDSKRTDLIHNLACAGSFRIRDDGVLLSALRAAQTGMASHLVGAVYKRHNQYSLGKIAGAGIRVVAEQDGRKLEAVTDSQGNYDFAGMAEGTWQVQVESPGLVHTSVWPERPVIVPARGCAVRYLSAASDGRVSGTVRDPDGKPVAGVSVQVFVFDSRGQLETRKFSEATTGPDGKYEINALPAQEYIVGINGEKYSDRGAYPPVFYSQTEDRDSAARVAVGEMERKTGIDLVVNRPRKPAKLVIECLYEDGTPVSAFGARIEDLEGTQRAFLNSEAPGEETSRAVNLWAGEAYRVNAFKYEVSGAAAEKIRVSEWSGESGVIQLFEPGTRVRIVLRPVVK
jgi:hypothetical protein